MTPKNESSHGEATGRGLGHHSGITAELFNEWNKHMWKLKDIKPNYNNTYVEAVFENTSGGTEWVLLNEEQVKNGEAIVLEAISKLNARSQRVIDDAARLKSALITKDSEVSSKPDADELASSQPIHTEEVAK